MSRARQSRGSITMLATDNPEISDGEPKPFSVAAKRGAGQRHVFLTLSVSEGILAPEVRLAEFIPTQEGLAVRKQALCERRCAR